LETRTVKKILVVTFVMLLVAAAFAGCGATAAPAAPVSLNTLPADISVQDAAKLRDAGAFVLDVREPAEWNQVHIPGATLIPLGELRTRANQVPKDKPVVVICHSGNRSKVGRDTLRQAGFTNVTSVNGGMNAWSAAGLPTVSGP
jgi:rhodanese-related sulfurtransferase